MPQPLQEYVDSRGPGLRVDRHAGVIRGVKILGLASRNGRRYLAAALRDAATLYEGAHVNVNHPKGGATAPRDYQDRIGVIRRVEFRDDGEPAGGLFGDLHFNPRHVLAEQLAWDAEHSPENVGLSHNVLAVTTRQGDEIVVESIAKVQSVDLVADPATTRGLFEQSSGETAAASTVGASETHAAWLATLTANDLETHRSDLVTVLREAVHAENAALREELDRLRAAAAVAERRRRLDELLAECDLPSVGGNASNAALISEDFVRRALSTPSDTTLRQLVEERAALVRSARQSAATVATARPASREQTRAESLLVCADMPSFVRAIT